METKTKYVCSLIGRTFVIASPFALKNWNGDVHLNDNETDYESLDNFISYEEGDLTFMKKAEDTIYYIYFSMSSKIEVFSVENGFVILDGLYFNESWDYSAELNINIKSIINLDFKVDGGSIYIFDAVLDGEAILLERSRQQAIIDRTKINISDGIYIANRVETSILIDSQEVLLKGIMATYIGPE